MRIILITGMSGSGKSVALNALEDAGYYCIDNLPPHFLPELVSFLSHHGYPRLAVAIDARAGNALFELPDIILRLREQHAVNLLFLKASTPTLLHRFAQTRRRHPLSTTDETTSEPRSLTDALEREREMIESLATLGHHIDTSNIQVKLLRTWVKQFIQAEHNRLILTFASFGFKNGIPLDADFMFDMRALPNPYYDQHLQALTGRDQAVADFLASMPEVQAMIDDIEAFLRKWLPSFAQDNRNYLTVALGCTGGQHRSVYVAETLGARLASEAEILVRHREIVLST